MVSPLSDKPVPFLSSAREKRLWTWSLAVIVAIYATLGLASMLADVLNNRGAAGQIASAVAFLTAMAFVGLTVLTQGLKARPRGVEIGIGLGIAVVYFMVFFRLMIPERSHLIEYSVLAVFVYEALTERASQGRRVPIPALLAILATSLVGVIDEFIQLFLPSRHFDWADILFNFLAGLLAVGAMVVLGWARRLAGRRPPPGSASREDRREP